MLEMVLGQKAFTTLPNRACLCASAFDTWSKSSLMAELQIRSETLDEIAALISSRGVEEKVEF